MTALVNEAGALLRAVAADRPVVATSIALGLAVLALVVLHVATAGAPVASTGFVIHYEIRLTRDRSMSEIFNYGMAFLASALFLLVFFESRSPAFLFLSVLMAFIWFDDSFRYHERFGEYLSDAATLPELPGARPRDVGQLFAWGAAGLVLAPLLLLALARRRPGDLGALAAVFAGFLALVAAGILADLVHVMAPRRFSLLLDVIEEGGEMFAIAFIAAIALGLSRNYGTYRERLAGGADGAPDGTPAPER